MRKEKNTKRIFAGDLVIYLTILVVAGLSYFMITAQPSDSKPMAVITQNGVELYRIDLDKAIDRKEIKIEGSYHELLVVENGRIRFEEADCPDKICVNTGWIARPGQVAVCVPAGVVVKIIGDNGIDEEIDVFLK